MASLRIDGLMHSREEISAKRALIYRQSLVGSKFLRPGTMECFHADDLERLFVLYDQYFLHHFFAAQVREGPAKVVVRFQISSRLTRAAGKVTHYHRAGRHEYLISLSSTLLLQTFRGEARPVVVNGIACRDRWDAAMRVFEHELVHLLEMLAFGSSSCRRPRFRQLAHNIFGHTDVTHNLVTGYELASKKYHLGVGDSVSFTFEGRRLKGILSRITKRATVMVEDAAGRYIDRKGTRYAKYYIPLQMLETEPSNCSRRR